MGEAWIIDAVRTPRSRGRKDVGALSHTHPQELMATTVRERSWSPHPSMPTRMAYGPRARVVSLATAGAEPVIMLTVPTPASRKALHKAGMGVRDIDLWEINEAFAVVPLKTMRDLEIDPERVNVNGGAIALGHPIGATGAMLLGTVLDELERRDASTGLITLCIGGGMGIATIIERL